MLQRLPTNLFGIKYLYPFVLLLLLFVGTGECFGQGVLTVSAVATSAFYATTGSCGLPNSVITVMASGGTGGPYTYMVDVTTQASNIFPNNTSGPHTVSVSD